MAATTSAPHLGRPASAGTSSALGRFGSLVRAETTILLRNRTAMFGAVAMPPAMALALTGLDRGSLSLGGFLVTTLLGMGLLFIVYYTLVTSLVARREQLVLKRLRTGEATSLEILLAPAVPLWALLILETGIGAGLAVGALGASVTHAWALPLAVILGASAWTGLAVWSATLTRTVESAQLTTSPAILITLLFSGFSLPLAIMPDAVQRVAHLLPLTPVVDLLNLAFAGRAVSGAEVAGPDAVTSAAGMAAVLVAWTAFTLWQGVTRFRWEPRS